MERLPSLFAGRLPGFSGATGWLNTEPLTPAEIHGHVVLVDFWTYTCINWIRTLPYVRAWAEVYGPHGLIVVGVHTPEFSVEHDIDNVRRAAGQMRVGYPVAIDNQYAVWDAFANRYWPALYIADAGGRIRHRHFGEGGYPRSEQVIRRLLADGGALDLAHPTGVDPRGIEARADWDNVHSPETYVGLARSVRFASPGGGVLDEPRRYELPLRLDTNEWALGGEWTVGSEAAVLNEPSGVITYRFHARDLNVVLAPPVGGAGVRFRVRVDGEPPRHDHGVDVDRDGNGVIIEPRLYQLIRQSPPIGERVFQIELFGAGAAALCFTFG